MVTIAVYSYFGVAVVGHQWIDSHKKDTNQLDLYYPFFLTLRVENLPNYLPTKI